MAEPRSRWEARTAGEGPSGAAGVGAGLLALAASATLACGPAVPPATTASDPAPSEPPACRTNAECVPPAHCTVPLDTLTAEARCHLYVTGPGDMDRGPACGADADCPPQQRCRRALPSGVWSPSVCCAPPGCSSDAECGAGERCDADGHCATIPCAADDDCPALLACDDGECARRACADDADCGDAYCVLGRCRAELGRCRAPRPPPP